MKQRTMRGPLMLLTVASTLVFTAFNTWSDPLSRAVEVLRSYVTQFTPEKIYIMTDRPYYAAGEIMWYKAWLVNGVDHKPDSPSQTLYAELMSPSGEVVLSKVLKSEGGGVAGDFFLPEGLASGEYTLRAYTHWMRNFDEAWMFRRTIRILRPGADSPQSDIRVEPGSQTDRLSFRWVLLDDSGAPLADSEVELSLQSGGTRIDRQVLKTDDRGLIVWEKVLDRGVVFEQLPHVEVSYRKGRERISYSLPIPALSANELHFLPEGGELIAGVEQKVAFKATDGMGRGVVVEGELYDDAGKQVAVLDDVHLGMGYVMFTPAAGATYTARVSLNRQPQREFPLPPVRDYGIHLSANMTDPDDVILSIRTVGLATDVTLIGHTRGELVFSGGALASPTGFIARVPKKNLKAGITHFTVFDGAGNPMAERLVFMPPNPRGNVLLLTDKEVYGRRDAVRLDIAYLDDTDKPIDADLAVSVIREHESEKDFTEGADIRSYLLLSSDLKGFVESPSYYMNPNEEVQMNADLLMLTHGWRRFQFKDYLSGTTPTIQTFVEDGISISGTFRHKGTGKAIRNEEITLAVNPQSPNYYTVRTDDQGAFRIDGLQIADSTVVVVQGNDNNGRRPIDFTVDPLYIPHKEQRWHRAIPTLPLASIAPGYSGEARNRLAIDKSFGLSNSVRMLGEITVEASAVTPEENQQEQYVRIYGKPDRSFVPTTADLQRGGTAFDLLRGRTGAFRITGSGAGTRVTSARAATLTSTTTPLFFLDGIEVDASAIARVRIQDIGVVDVLTEVSSTVMFGARGSNGVISVFTRKGGPAPIPETNTASRKVPGYYSVRQFYAPNYAKKDDLHRKPDSRSTLWWAHTVRTDRTGLAKVAFFTSDDPGTYRIRVEGVDADGMPLYKESTFRVE